MFSYYRRAPRSVKILISTVMFCLYPLILEALLRLINYQPPSSPYVVAFVNPEWQDSRTFVLDRLLYWKFRPNQKIGGYNEKQGHYQIPINNIGFRGRRYPDLESKECYRVMFLGDSCVFGWDQPERYNFPDLLLDKLSNQYPDIKFHAFQGAVPGYSSFQALSILMRYGIGYRPDMVIVYCGTNDALPCVNFPDAKMMENAGVFWDKMILLEKSRLFCACRHIMTSLYHPAESVTHEKSSLLAHTVRSERERARASESLPRVSLDEFKDNFTKIARISQTELHARLVALTRQDMRPTPPVSSYNQIVREVGPKLGFAVVDVENLFANSANPESLYARPAIDPIHPNDKGYEMIASAVFQSVMASGLK